MPYGLGRCSIPSLAAKGIEAGSLSGDRGDSSELILSSLPPLPPVLNLLRFLVEKSDLRPSDFIPFDRVQGEVGSVDAPSASWAWPMLPDMLPLP
jgi:hypothetical protein